MFFIFKLMLIVLLNETYAHIMRNIETILLPTLNLTCTEKIPLTFKVFGKQIQLNLRRNDQIVSSMFKVWKHDAKSITEKLSQLIALDCFYFHIDHISTAAIHFSQEHEWEGFVFLKNDTLEIRPLRNDFASLSTINDLCVKEKVNISFGKPHLIKRSLQLSADSSFHNSDNIKLKRHPVQNTQKKLTIELAVFFDEAAYHTFMPFLDDDEEKLRMLILAYVNRIQALYHHSSFGISIDISLVYLEIMEEQPINLPVHNNASKMLDSFCKYAEIHNPPDDNDPHHWDIGLYLTGISMLEDTLGLTKHDGVCELNRSCAVVEFGTEQDVTSGFSSSLTAAHEIGHVLGMDHDDEYRIPCDKVKYIMSSMQLYQGQITWSVCSRDIAGKLWYTKECLRDHTKPENFVDAYDHSRYRDLPGRQWTAKAQCEIFFHDKDANVIILLDICKTLQCGTPHDGYFFTGPALEGTHCAHKKECRGGECVPVIEYNFKHCRKDNWSEWKESICQSSCLEKSKGVRVRRRSCKHRNRRTANCEGPYYDVILCDDTLLCPKKRETINSFNKNKCKNFNKMTKINNLSHLTLDLATDLEPGWQASHDVDKPWIACTIHCRRKNSSLYAPYFEMLFLAVVSYLPDGTWCHNKDGQNYYCRQHYCLPESYSQE